MQEPTSRAMPRPAGVTVLTDNLPRRTFILAAVFACVSCRERPDSAVAYGDRKLSLFSIAGGESEFRIFPPTDDYYDGYEDLGRGIRYVSAADLDLTNNEINPHLALVINADTVRIAEPLLLPGRSLVIVARRIEFLSSGSIDCSGPIGNPNFQEVDNAADGASLGFGRDGIDGIAGGGGDAAGDVSLFAEDIIGALTIKVSGGAGGRPQGGGAGAEGTPGAMGSKVGDAGGAGGPGGKGGLAGRPGDGGKGGSVLIAYGGRQPIDAWSIVTSGGEEGKPSRHGEPGPGGRRGAGHDGKVTYCEP